MFQMSAKYNPPVRSRTPSSASSMSPKRFPPSRKRKNDDPLDEMLMESIKVMKEKSAPKELKSRNVHFCMDIADRLDHMPDRESAIAKLKILQIITDLEYPSNPE